jgi:hypothetical protein
MDVVKSGGQHGMSDHVVTFLHLSVMASTEDPALAADDRGRRPAHSEQAAPAADQFSLVDLGGYSVSWAESGTAFGNAVARALHERSLPATYGRLQNGLFHCAVENRPAYGTLLSIPMQGGINCVLVLQTSGINPTTVSLWVDAISKAVEAIKEYSTFHWSALIGPSPRSVRSNYALAAPATAGPVEIKPGNRYMRELTRNPLDDQFSRTEWGSWPAVVNGSVRALDFDLARDIALEHLHRVCELISVAWDAWWTVRHGPLLVIDKLHELHVPDSPFADELALFTTDAVPSAKERGLPGWLGQAWSNLDKLPHLQGALASFYEAIQLSVLHSSFATVGFVAAVEAVGAGPTSNSSGRIRNRPSGNEAFKAGLKSVMSPDAASKLGSVFYRRRSSTAHVGKLHGTERRFGMWPNVYFGPNPSAEFFQETSRIRNLSRIVLANALIAGR